MTEPEKRYAALPYGGAFPPLSADGLAPVRPARLNGLGARRMQTGPPAERLRIHLRQQLSERMAQHIRDDDAAGRPPMTDTARLALAEKILADAAEEHTQKLLVGGQTVVAPDVEQAVITTVLNEVFGLAGLEPLLNDP